MALESLGSVEDRAGSEQIPRFVIRRVKLAHCKRGPSRCVKCREMKAEVIGLLDISPPDAGMRQRRVMELEWGGVKLWREYDIVRVFESEEDAEAYAAANGVKSVEL